MLQQFRSVHATAIQLGPATLAAKPVKKQAPVLCSLGSLQTSPPVTIATSRRRSYIESIRVAFLYFCRFSDETAAAVAAAAAVPPPRRRTLAEAQSRFARPPLCLLTATLAEFIAARRSHTSPMTHLRPPIVAPPRPPSPWPGPSSEPPFIHVPSSARPVLSLSIEI
ncbi:hypothetical protein NL676_031891 [Syzygium grande]|nr:hypothetical protein NL676_031891 [Syzygium grande]